MQQMLTGKLNREKYWSKTQIYIKKEHKERNSEGKKTNTTFFLYQTDPKNSLKHCYVCMYVHVRARACLCVCIN